MIKTMASWKIQEKMYVAARHFYRYKEEVNHNVMQILY